MEIWPCLPTETVACDTGSGRDLVLTYVRVEHVADAANSLYHFGPPRVGLDLAPKAAHLNVDAAVEQRGLAAMGVIEDLVA